LIDLVSSIGTTGSILAKVSLPVEHAGVAIIKLCSLPYTGTSAMFLRTLLNKKFSLPVTVIALVVHVCFFLAFYVQTCI
jgi:essential nuclear protein 1